jgi:TatD DNase family protein
MNNLEKEGIEITESDMNKILLDLEIFGLIRVSWLSRDKRRIETVAKSKDDLSWVYALPIFLSLILDAIFYDSHIHLADSEYSDILPYLLASMNALHIKACSVTVDIETSNRALKLFGSNRDIVRNFVGIHPQYANAKNSSGFDQIVLQNHQVIDGIGEIGLDPTYCDLRNDYSEQIKVFKHMLEIAKELKKPVSIHSRGSLDEILNILSTYDYLKICLHWFDGTERQLQRSMDMGLYVSYSPSVVYSKRKRRLLKLTDNCKLLIETDGPVKYPACFEHVTALPTSMLASIVYTISQELKTPFRESSVQICYNSIDFFGSWNGKVNAILFLWNIIAESIKNN